MGGWLYIDGGGGGSNFLAMAGGKNADGISDAIDSALEQVKKVIDNG